MKKIFIIVAILTATASCKKDEPPTVVKSPTSTEHCNPILSGVQVRIDGSVMVNYNFGKKPQTHGVVVSTSEHPTKENATVRYANQDVRNDNNYSVTLNSEGQYLLSENTRYYLRVYGDNEYSREVNFIIE